MGVSHHSLKAEDESSLGVTNPESQSWKGEEAEEEETSAEVLSTAVTKMELIPTRKGRSLESCAVGTGSIVGGKESNTSYDSAGCWGAEHGNPSQPQDAACEFCLGIERGN